MVTPDSVDRWGTSVLPTPVKPRKPVGLGDVVLGLLYSQVFAAVVVASVLVVSVARITTFTPNEVDSQLNESLNSAPVTILALLATWAGFMLATWWAATRKGDGDWRTVLSWGFNWKRDIPIAVVFVLAYRSLEAAASAILASVGVDTRELSNTGLVTDFTGVWLVVLAIAAIVGAPLVEEVFFRGLFLTTARRRLGTVAAVIVSSVVFGVLHAQITVAGSFYTITATTLIGAGLAVLVVRTGRLGTAIAAHVLMNASGVALALLFT